MGLFDITSELQNVSKINHVLFCSQSSPIYILNVRCRWQQEQSKSSKESEKSNREKRKKSKREEGKNSKREKSENSDRKESKNSVREERPKEYHQRRKGSSSKFTTP